jgi:2-polyprenyl-6-methoxyphenol hydroxylase-like FAD-dependent oxidoreductase
MSGRLGQQAIVIGGSIAGLMAARVLSDFFEQVTVLERDAIADDPAVHKSVPQGNHLHALMLGGQNVMTSLYPNFTERLQKIGAIRFRTGQDIGFYSEYGKAYSPSGTIKEPRNLGSFGFSQSRGLLEYCLRQCTLETPNLKLRTETPVHSLICENGRVSGVKAGGAGGDVSLTADLVVDAGGRGSRALRWLAENGYKTPEETSIGCDFAYSSAKFRRPASYDGEPVMLFGGRPPKYTSGAGIAEIEDGLWMVSLAGRFGDFPPVDPEGFIAFAKSIPTPKLYQLLEGAERVTEISHHRFPTSVQRHYERLTAFPERFIVLGDAISSFNPVYGQGMSSASMQVRALQEILKERASGKESAGLEGMAAAFFPKAAEVIATPWLLSSASDFIYPQTKGERPPGMVEGARYFAALDALSAEDIEVQRIVNEVFQLVRPVWELTSEPLRSRVLERQQKMAGA